MRKDWHNSSNFLADQWTFRPGLTALGRVWLCEGDGVPTRADGLQWFAGFWYGYVILPGGGTQELWPGSPDPTEVMYLVEDHALRTFCGEPSTGCLFERGMRELKRR